MSSHDVLARRAIAIVPPVKRPLFWGLWDRVLAAAAAL